MNNYSLRKVFVVEEINFFYQPTPEELAFLEKNFSERPFLPSTHEVTIEGKKFAVYTAKEWEGGEWFYYRTLEQKKMERSLKKSGVLSNRYKFFHEPPPRNGKIIVGKNQIC